MDPVGALADRDDAAGAPVTTPGGHCHYLGGVAAPTAAGVRAAVREHVERGVDVIKIMASGGGLTPGTYQHLPQFPPEVRARLPLIVANTRRMHEAGAQIVAGTDAGIAPDPGGVGSRHRRAGRRVASWRNAGGQPSSGSSVMRSSAVSMPLRQTERAMILLGSTRLR